MAGFPGDAAYAEGWTFRLGPDCPVNVSRVSFSVHCGTHADAPLHYDAQGAAAAALPLEPYIGPCRVIDARGAGPVCEPAQIAAALTDAPPRILLRLMDRLDPKVWPTGFRALAPETVDLLASKGVRLVGIDTPSVDPETSKTLAAHHACRAADMRILENLVLSYVEPGDYELIALPLKFENLDASPVRAVLRR
ncbi:arylformamidase [Aestuariivirga litoralis]|uniref:Arylformamidase n=2 Tax=Aestuariivirga litoralis TaxID=2650924 RepID=A0A2W2AWV1_9HYPH|nr:arylformamidase [Aestuariivirga litoralis]